VGLESPTNWTSNTSQPRNNSDTATVYSLPLLTVHPSTVYCTSFHCLLYILPLSTHCVYYLSGNVSNVSPTQDLVTDYSGSDFSWFYSVFSRSFSRRIFKWSATRSCQWIYDYIPIRTQACEFNPLNPELNPICYLLALLGAHHFLHVSRIRVKS